MAKIAVKIITTGPTGAGSQPIDRKFFKKSEMTIVTGGPAGTSNNQPLPITQAEYDASVA